MSDEYEDFVPGDEDAEDFRNFDPANYRRRRNTSSDPIGSDEQPASSDFDNFDPSKYIRKRRPLESYVPDASAESESGRRGRRSGRSSAYEEPTRGRAGGMGALGATLLGLFSSGELFASPAWRTIRPFITLIGCVIVLAIGAVCAVGFWLAQALAQR